MRQAVLADLHGFQGRGGVVGNPVQRQRTKHIRAPYHYVRQLVEEGVVDFQRVASKDNAADVLTKGNSPLHFSKS